MDAYRIDSLRFAAEYTGASAAAGVTKDCTDFVVPANTIRTILFMSYGCDVAESRSIIVKVIGASGITHAIRGAFTVDTNLGNPHAVLEQGNEVRLIPGDRLRFDRSAATAGSIMSLYVRYIDEVQPYQIYIDPQGAKRIRSRFLSKRSGGGSSGGSAAGGGGGTIEGPTGARGGGGIAI